MRHCPKGTTPKTEIVELLTTMQILVAKRVSYAVLWHWAEEEIVKRTGRH